MCLEELTIYIPDTLLAGGRECESRSLRTKHRENVTTIREYRPRRINKREHILYGALQTQNSGGPHPSLPAALGACINQGIMIDILIS